MQGGKIFFIVGILGLIAGVATLVVGIVLIVKSRDADDEVITPVFHEPSWGYECRDKVCVKTAITSATTLLPDGLNVCRLRCNSDEIGSLWPKPTGAVTFSTTVAKIDPSEINFNANILGDSEYWTMAKDRFEAMQKKKMPKHELKSGGKHLMIDSVIAVGDMAIKLGMDESYRLELTELNDHFHAKITANNFYGARHGLETLSQLITYDEVKNEAYIIGSADIADAPKFKYRGVMLDTARNYFPIDFIKRTIDGLAMVKLNTFHWHITDSQSFPFVVESQPELSKIGAYTPEKIYTAADIKDVVKYAKARGVRVLPEYDTPSHVGAGWENKDLTTCYNFKPWTDFCYEPPCGQIDPSKPAAYDLLEDIYRELVAAFEKPDIFSLGGDEIWFECWNSSATLQAWMIEQGWNLDEVGFMEMWNYFQVRNLERLDKVYPEKVPIIMWESTLTEDPYALQYLDKDRYIIQIWLDAFAPQIKYLLENGYKLIISPYDKFYLDCGFPGWVTDGHNWCSPYHGWHEIYDYKMEDIAGEYIDQIHGGETPLWAEQADAQASDSRIWPRAAALAERLWSNPETSWRDADSRMLITRQRLVTMGIAADRLQPEWCLQNEGECQTTLF